MPRGWGQCVLTTPYIEFGCNLFLTHSSRTEVYSTLEEVGRYHHFWCLAPEIHLAISSRKRVLLFFVEEFRVPVSSLCRKMIVNANIFLFPQNDLTHKRLNVEMLVKSHKEVTNCLWMLLGSTYRRIEGIDLIDDLHLDFFLWYWPQVNAAGPQWR